MGARAAEGDATLAMHAELAREPHLLPSHMPPAAAQAKALIKSI